MRRKLGEILLAHGAVSPADVESALADQSAGESARLGDQLVASGRITPAQLAQALSEQSGIPFTGLPHIPESVLALVDHDFERQYRLVPFRDDGSRVLVALADPANIDIVAHLAEGLGREVVAFIAPGDEIDAILAAVSGEVVLPLDDRPPDLALPLVAPSVPAMGLSGEHSIDDFFGELAAEAPAAQPGQGLDGLFDGLSLENAMPAFTEPELRAVELPPDDSASLTLSADDEFAALADGLEDPAPAAGPAVVEVAPVEDEDAFYSSLEDPAAAGAPAPVATVTDPELAAELFDGLGGEDGPTALTEPGEELEQVAAAAPVVAPEEIGTGFELEQEPEPAPEALAAPPEESAARAAPAAASRSAAGAAALPAWLQADGGADVGGWTGSLDGVDSEQLARALARALVRRGILSEQDLLDALDDS